MIKNKLQKSPNFFMASCVLALVFLIDIPCLAEVADKIIAVVNDQTITKTEIEEAMKPITQELNEIYDGQFLEERLKQARKDVLERLIEDRLILQEAKKQKIEVRGEEVEERVRQIKSKFANEESFQKAMKLQGINMWELRKTCKEQLMVRKMVRQYVRERANITPGQILQYYQKHSDSFRVTHAVAASQILIRYKPDEESARTERTTYQVAGLLKEGCDFADIVKRYSEGPNAQSGGDIGWIERGAMTKEIDDVIFSMKEGEISQPIKTNIGFAIFKINSIRKERFLPLEEGKDQIEETLLDQNAKTILENWVEQLKEGAFISIKE